MKPLLFCALTISAAALTGCNQNTAAPPPPPTLTREVPTARNGLMPPPVPAGVKDTRAPWDRGIAPLPRRTDIPAPANMHPAGLPAGSPPRSSLPPQLR